MAANGPGTLEILLLEDMRLDAELLIDRCAIDQPHWAIHWVSNAADFAAALADPRFQLILSDYELPGYSGLDAMDDARRLAPETPFIFVSGVIGEENAVEMLKRGATDYVIKGRLARLPVVVERALREVAERRDRLASAQQLRDAKEEAERANRAKDRFLAVLSHELRTPLMPIAAAAQLLERRAQVPPECATLLPMIKRNVALEARLIDDLLDLTSIRQGKLQLHWSTVDLHEVVHTAVEMLEADAQRKGIDVAVDLQATRRVVRGDAARLLQVVWNVLRNAVKFTLGGGRIRLASADVGTAEMALSCTDSGIGIRPEALARIFVPFEQADEEVARTYGGLGLGLAIASNLAAEHGGRLQAASDGPGHGAVFTLVLPAQVPDLAEQGGGTALPAEGASPTARLLLVEDSADAAESLRLALGALGYDVTVAATLHDGIGAAEAGGFDVVVSDLGLPDGSGAEMARRFGARLPVIALSGYGSEADVQASLASGFAQHLTKPIDPEALHRGIERLLRPPV